MRERGGRGSGRERERGEGGVGAEEEVLKSTQQIMYTLATLTGLSSSSNISGLLLAALCLRVLYSEECCLATCCKLSM